jgi:hypothetical protein
MRHTQPVEPNRLNYEDRIKTVLVCRPIDAGAFSFQSIEVGNEKVEINHNDAQW